MVYFPYGIVFAQDVAGDILAEWKIPVTTGAAAGYVPDTACALCHGDKAETFSLVGMGKSFYRPSAENAIEDFRASHFYHAPSGRYYEMSLRNREYWFTRYQLAGDGTRINLFERKVDWILGSGHHARTYLYRTADGALFQLPLAWYSQDGKWAMAPGFEWELTPGVMREVRRQCMFCHNAFPQMPAGSDTYGLPDTFPESMPEGIGCQRCHGPGSDHVRLALSADEEMEALRAAIVNPANLPRERLYSICYGCHMQPSVSVPGVRRFGRNAYSFRPGELLADFRAEMDIVDSDRPRQERFEINNHPYRLEQSACFIRSEGKLGCLTCHDPHRKVMPVERAAHYRTACLTCHETAEDGLPRMRNAATRHPAISPDADCTACHMPARRTQDVINVTMTDHRIVRGTGELDLLAPIEKKDANVSEVLLKDESHGLGADEAVMYKAIAVLRYTNGLAGDAAGKLAELLLSQPSIHHEPWYELAKSMIRRKQFGAALPVIAEAERRAPGHAGMREMLAVAKFGLGESDAAIDLLESLLAEQPILPETRYKLAVIYQSEGDDEAALRHARIVLEGRDNHWAAWRLIGEIEAARGRPLEAAGAFRAALAIEPADPRSRNGLVAALETLGEKAEAARYRAVVAK